MIITMGDVHMFWGFPGGLSGKEPPANARDVREVGSILSQISPEKAMRPLQASVWETHDRESCGHNPSS